MNKFRLTNSLIRQKCLPPAVTQKTSSGKPVLQKVYMDSDLKGFGVLVTRTDSSKEPTYTFFAQRFVHGRTVRVKIARLGEISADEARKRAHVLIAKMVGGVNPNAEKKELRAKSVTFGQAAAAYREKPAKRTRAPKSKLTLVNHDIYADLLRDWHNRPLKDISRAEVLARHKRLTKSNGPVAANNVMRWFRSVYNAALVLHETLPPNPSIVLNDYWNPEERKRSPIAWSALPEWMAWVNGPLFDRNPVRADLQLFLLFSGLRSEDARSVRIDEIDIEGRKIKRPKPKGGESRAFDLPLSNALIQIVEGRLRQNAFLYGINCPWLFPTFDTQGRLAYVSSPKEKGRQSPHRLRDTYLTAAHEVGVPDLDQKILVNHVLPKGGDVTDGYKLPSWDYLISQQERISGFLQEKAGLREGPKLKVVGGIDAIG